MNNDAINTQFVITIESAVTTAGDTVSINQVIDSSISSNLTNTIYISSKPYIEMKMTSNSNWINDFNTLSQSTAKPSTLVEGVAVYAQLKPLPGRANVTSIKGTTYPVGGIKYTINQNIYYQSTTGVKKELKIGTDTDPVQAVMYQDGPGEFDRADRNFTNEYSSYSSNYSFLSSQGTIAPYGYGSTRTTYNTQGVYDTGKPIVSNGTNNTIIVSNTDYKPISLKNSNGGKLYYFNGAIMPSSVEPFSSVYMQAVFPYAYLESMTEANSNMTYKLSISKVEYEGTTQSVNTSTQIKWDNKWPGTIYNLTAFIDRDAKGLNSNPVTTNYYQSLGDGRTTQGNKLWLSNYQVAKSSAIDRTIIYSRWNANSFTYDTSRETTALETYSANFDQFYYGVGPKVPNQSHRSAELIDSAYTWYNSVSEATASGGTITAIKAEYSGGNPSGQIWDRFRVPVIATGPIGVDDAFGNPNVLYTNSFNYDKKNKDQLVLSFPPLNGTLKYVPTGYNSEGVMTTTANPVNSWGDTIYISSVLIRPTIKADKSNYNPTENITWTATGNVTSSSDDSHKVELVVTIPKETNFVYGTSKNNKGETIPDPVVVENSDGTKTLTYVQDYLVSSNLNPSVSFETSIIASELNFTNNQATLNANVVSQVWLEEKPDIDDTSSVKDRTAATAVTISSAGVVLVDKVTKQPYIEAGNVVDPAEPSIEHPTDITFTISYKNQSTVDIGDLRALDVLPYNGDGRGTSYTGTYSVVDVTNSTNDTSTGTAGDIWYTENVVSVDLDPNSVSLTDGSWKKLGTDQSVLKNAKAVMVVYKTLGPGKAFHYSVTMRPDGQKAGDIYANNPTLNPNLDIKVSGVVSTSSVLGRNLSGLAWYDDNLDGILDSGESLAENIPIKLYRTSLVNTTYSQELVKETLTGEKLVDDSNNSLLITNNEESMRSIIFLKVST